MKATDERQLWAFETAIESATRQILIDAEVANPGEILVPRTDLILPDARIEVTFELGQAINQADIVRGADEIISVYDFFEGVLAVKLFTQRFDSPFPDPAIGDLHTAYATGVRFALQEYRCPFTEANLPYHAVTTIRPQAVTRDLEPRFMEDFTELPFFIQVGIRSDAWPDAG